MSLFRFRWLHKLIRKKTNPIPEKEAALWKQRLSIIYMLCAWNAFGMLMYFTFAKKRDWGEYYGIKTDEEINKRPAVYYAELLGLKKAHVIDIKNFKKVNEYDYAEKQMDDDVEKEVETEN